MATHAPSGPYKLVTVNTAPERAKVIIGRVVEAVKERYTIDYVANAESMLIFFDCICVCAALSRFRVPGRQFGAAGYLNGMRLADAVI